MTAPPSLRIVQLNTRLAFPLQLHCKHTKKCQHHVIKGQVGRVQCRQPHGEHARANGVFHEGW